MAAQWIGNYLQGSFRGVEFFIQSASNTIGRRQANHEFPGRDEPFAEDLGRKAKTFSLECYIIDDNYFNRRNELIKALDTDGPGELVHPYLGTFQAVVMSSSFSERTSEGRMVRFSITFQEQKEISLTISVKNTRNFNFAKRNSLFDAIRDFFLQAYDIAQAPVGVLQDVLDSIDNVSELLLLAKQTVASVSDFQRELSNIKGKGIQLVLDAQDLVDSFASVVSFGTSIADAQNTATADNARRQFFESRTVLERQKASSNLDTTDGVFNNLIYQQSVASAAGLVSVIEFTSLSDADEIYNLINTELDFIENQVGASDEILAAVRDMRAAIRQDIDERTEGLGEIYEYRINDQSRPTIAVSNSIYGEIDSEQDVINRNKIQNPFFASGTLNVVVNNG